MSANKNETIYRKVLPWIIGILFWTSIILLIVAIGSFIASFWFDEEWLTSFGQKHLAVALPCG